MTPDPSSAWAVLRRAGEVSPDRLAPELRALGLDPGLPPDLESFDQTLDSNLTLALHSGILDTATAGAIRSAWTKTLRTHRPLRAADGNVVFVHTDTASTLDRWLWLGDWRGSAQTHAARWPDDASPQAPAILLGMAPPWGVLAVAEHLNDRPALAPGFRRGLVVIEPNPHDAARALAVADWSPMLSRPGARLWIGPDAIERFSAQTASHPQLAHPQRLVCTGGSPEAAAAAAGLQDAVAVLKQGQTSTLADSIRGANAVARALTPGQRAARLADANAGHAPARVLLCVSRFSTFLHTSVRDLAGAFERLGHQTSLLTEPDQSSTLSRVAYARAVAGFDPDLVLGPNYSRRLHGEAVPREIPYVCWIQDAMPHLFDPEEHRNAGPLDLIAGHTFRRLFTEFGRDPASALPFPIPVSDDKFHDRPASPGLLERTRCDVAFISHHAETPEGMRTRLAAELNAGPQGVALIARLDRAAQEIVDRAAEHGPKSLAEGAAREAFTSAFGKAPTPHQLATVMTGALEPMIGRRFRHQALEWAQEICARRGWTLKVFGNGWERSPFAAHAAGPLEHGEPLRAAYQSAGVFLHLDPFTIVHQRVLEGALSGGLPAIRIHADALTRSRLNAVDEMDQLGTTSIADAPSAMAYTALRQRLALAADNPCSGERPPELFPPGAWDAYDPARTLGDLAELGFSSPQGLEQLLDHAQDPGLRQGVSGMVAGRVRATLTTTAFAGALLEHAARRVGAHARASTITPIHAA